MVVLMMTMMVFALLLPVTIRTEAQHDGKTSWRVTVRYACFSRTWPSVPKASGSASGQQRRHQFLAAIRNRGNLPPASVRRFLLRHIQLDGLDALVLLHTGDAAHAALLSGGLQGLMNIPALPLNKVHIRILPDFFRGKTTWQTRCIFHVRLGIIILTLLMLPAARLQQKARTAYGTSHW